MAGQDGGQSVYVDDTDSVQTTRTIRESTERAAAAALTGNTGSRMFRPETHRTAADKHQSTAENNTAQLSEVETKPEPEIGGLSLEVAECKRSDESVDDCHRDAVRLGDSEAHGRHSSTTQPEIVTRRPVAVRKPTCQEARSERFDRVVQYVDSRQCVSGRSVHYCKITVPLQDILLSL